MTQESLKKHSNIHSVLVTVPVVEPMIRYQLTLKLRLHILLLLVCRLQDHRRLHLFQLRPTPSSTLNDMLTRKESSLCALYIDWDVVEDGGHHDGLPGEGFKLEQIVR